MQNTNLSWADSRAIERDAVDYSAKGTGPKGEWMTMLIVDMSPMGMMVRSNHDLSPGDRMRVNLPDVGAVVAEVRWSMAGRMGCQFVEPIDRARYYTLLAALMRN